MSTATPLPTYKNPPVSEVALSVEFAPLTKWGIVHFGAFWSEIRNEFPIHEVHPPLASQIEKFGPDARRPAEMFEFVTGMPELRCWFSNENGRLLQVQRDHFVFNWRKRPASPTYPRYVDTVRPEFEREYNRFRAFIAAAGLGPLEVRQCEITYINDIPEGGGWNVIGDLPRVLNPWSGTGSTGFLPPPETASLALSYPMPEERGRLHVSVKHVVRTTDLREMLQMQLVARGAPRGMLTQDLLEWFDQGREWVVRGFTDLTTPRMHQLWEREE